MRKSILLTVVLLTLVCSVAFVSTMANGQQKKQPIFVPIDPQLEEADNTPFLFEGEEFVNQRAFVDSGRRCGS